MIDPPRLSFAARLRLMRNKRYDDWWHIVFGGPFGTFIAAVVADVRWITPNVITLVGFTMRLVGAALLLVRAPWADYTALALLETSLVLDITDGSLARYRKRPSALGAFLDKITDGASLATLGLVLGYRAWLDGHGALHLAAGGFIGASYLLRCYMYWVVAYLERERGAAATVGPRAQRPFGELSFGERLQYYLSQTWKVLLFGEGDVYFWVGLAIILGRIADVVILLAGTMAFWLLVIAGRRIATVIRLDRDVRLAREAAAVVTPPAIIAPAEAPPA